MNTKITAIIQTITNVLCECKSKILHTYAIYLLLVIISGCIIAVIRGNMSETPITSKNAPITVTSPSIAKRLFCLAFNSLLNFPNTENIFTPFKLL